MLPIIKPTFLGDNLCRSSFILFKHPMSAKLRKSLVDFFVNTVRRASISRRSIYPSWYFYGGATIHTERNLSSKQGLHKKLKSAKICNLQVETNKSQLNIKYQTIQIHWHYLYQINIFKISRFFRKMGHLSHLYPTELYDQ